MAIDRDVRRRGATTRPTVASSRARPSSTASSTSRPTVRRSPSAVRPAWGRAVAGVVRDARRARTATRRRRSRRSRRPSRSAPACRRARRSRSRSRSRWATSPASRCRRASSRSPRSAPSTSRPACRAASRTSWRRVRGRRRARAAHRLPHARRSNRSRSRPSVGVLVVHSGVARTLEGSPWRAAPRRELRGRGTARRCACCATRRPTRSRDEPRGRHVVTEMRACARSRDALRAGDVDALGPLMLASHASSRDDMEVSIARARRARRVPRATRARSARASPAAASAAASSRSSRPSAARAIATTAAAAYSRAHPTRSDRLGRALRPRAPGR